jgi:superfamily II DNA or RNA helicase
MLGRGSRPAPGKEYFNIIDHGNHGHRLGMYRDPRKFSLIHKQTKGGAAAPVKECGAKKRKNVKADPVTGYYPDRDDRPGCGSYINASTMICPFCGYKYDTEKEILEAEFEEYKYDIAPAQHIKIKEPDEIDEIIRKQESRGYKEGWAIRKIAYKLGIDGLKKYAEKRNYKKTWALMQAKRLKIA